VRKSYAQEKLQPRIVAAFADEQTDAGIFPRNGHMGLLAFRGPRNTAAWVLFVSYGSGRPAKVETVDSGYRSMNVCTVVAGLYPIF